MKNLNITIHALVVFMLIFAFNSSVLAQTTLAQRLAGRILLQVESHGEAWYVNPKDLKKYYLGNPYYAFNVMRYQSIGATDADLNKIPLVTFFNTSAPDNDRDGVPNDAEIAMGTDPNNSDTDNDGYNDLTEIVNGYDPNGSGQLPIDKNFTKNNLGKIFLQVQNRGQAWYINPVNQARYFLGQPEDAYIIMKYLGLGITNADLNQIITGSLPSTPATPPSVPLASPPATPPIIPVEQSILEQAADSIRSNDLAKTQSFFIEAMSKSIEYTMNYLGSDSKLLLANILSGASFTSSTDTEKTYSTQAYFSLGGYNIPLHFYVRKQPDGSWLISNL